jgi:hypothetical protein
MAKMAEFMAKTDIVEHCRVKCEVEIEIEGGGRAEA